MNDIRQVQIPEVAVDLADKLHLILASAPGIEAEDVGSALGLVTKEWALAWAGVEEETWTGGRHDELVTQARAMIAAIPKRVYTCQEMMWMAGHILGGMSETARFIRETGFPEAGEHVCEGA